ncbi:hypothetical protein CKAN_02677400 [Cinnamomum micranthum f. kanehirae]|uniref:Uncharacterized protein n=1 Tax=Cinnamomum micranthum f. kanehirae TaxID=337451 RepID=A0A443Q2V0_9MAGN|nr:hypothetical protein CKAN_02677400 [Cinnamomum micranthum f. kanehirae]
MESEKGEEVEIQGVGSGGETQEMELANELKQLKRRRSQLLEEIDILEKEAEEDRKGIKLSAPLPLGKWRKLLISDLSRPEDTTLFNMLDMVEVAANLHAIAASQVASAAAIASRAASVARDFAQAAPHVHTATGPQADAVQAAAFAVAAEIVRLTTSAASAAAAAKSITNTAALVQDAVANALAAALDAAAAATTPGPLLPHHRPQLEWRKKF